MKSNKYGSIRPKLNNQANGSYSVLWMEELAIYTSFMQNIKKIVLF